MNRTTNILFIGLVWPEPKSSAAGTRIIQLAQFFAELGYAVHFASAAAKGEYSFNLESIGLKEIAIKLNDDSFNEMIRGLCPQTVIYDRFVTEEQYGWRVHQECPDAIKVLDTEDLHCLRHARRKGLATPQALQPDYNTELAKREIASILRCDLSLIISELEMTLLQDQFRIDQSLLCYLPFMETEITAATIADWTPYEGRAGFTFIGNFLHEPNWHTVQVLKKEIWPLIRKQLPLATLHIYGAYPSEKVFQLHQLKEGFIIEGRAEDARLSISRHKLMLAPIRFGAGLKGKFIDAMQTGTPSVTTTVGSEAMSGTLPWSGEIAADKSNFVDAAVKLYSNRELWITAQAKATAIINERYANPVYTSEMEEKIRNLSANLAEHRMKNFVGEILRHHTLQSTKYMSLWIQEKNSNV